MSLLLTVLAAIVPLLITPGVLFHYDITPKIVVILVVAAAGLMQSGSLAKGVGALWNRRCGRWLCLLASVQTIWLAVCSAFSMRPWFSLLGTSWRRMGLLTMLAIVVCTVFAAAGLCLMPAATAVVLRATSGAAILASSYGIAQYFDIDPWQAAAGYHAMSGDSIIVRPPGTMGHADFFGWWLAIALFCGYGLAASERCGWRWAGRAACLLSGVAILFTGTRSAMLAVLAGFGFIFASSGTRALKIYIFAGFTLTFLVTGLYFSPVGKKMRARVEWSVTEPTGGARPLLWRDSVRMAAERPLTGFGPETFAVAFPRYQSTDLARLLPAFYEESPHNTALDALTSEGVPGLVLAFGWVAIGFGAAYRARTGNNAPTPALVAALTASAVASVFSAVTAGPLLATSLILAMLVAGTPEEQTPVRKLRRGTLLILATPLAIGFIIYAGMLVTSDLALARFQRDTGAAAYRGVIETAMPGAAEDLYCSRQLARLCSGAPECITSAIQAASRATETADNPANAWYNLAIFEAARNEPATVEKALRTSIALAPQWFKPRWALATLLGVTGRPTEARAEAERALFLDAGKDPEVVQTVRQLTGQTTGQTTGKTP